ncbi:UPF0187-domain-containing protein [Schizopora paradoxa]|uniref:UPF0187-domain-containing protein n=1 Tax=Schizopora paradoxa TaxID=27342 RepID=A0A0H2RUA2_9AGAM|nr:UPF0187-domain-containing protein [Schizopora paradoxa]
MQHHSNHFGGVEDAKSPLNLLSSLFKAVLATALFRCWHLLIFFAAWATAVSLINHKVTGFTFQPTLLTVVGTVLGFVISYRTTSSFERYNEGRRYWSQIILASRTLSRAVWFHIPDVSPASNHTSKEDDEMRARTLIEKKTVINLIEAFAVAVKHYLRGEEGINYEDLYHLVKFLPSYAFPAGIVPPEESTVSLGRTMSRKAETQGADDSYTTNEKTDIDINVESPNGGDVEALTTGRTSPHVTLPAPVTSRASFKEPLSPTGLRRSQSGRSRSSGRQGLKPTVSYGFADDEEVVLQPSSLPPKFAVFDIFPLSLLIKLLAKEGRAVEGKKAARYRAKSAIVTRNVPLEIATYLSSYVAILQSRKAIDVPTTNLLIASVNQLQDALTGLERILTTPIPFSYSIHLWLVTMIYCLALPLQIWPTLKFITIPATTILAFIFFGFLVAGEEIENPFGYDKNDLNMDHFTQNIIRAELHALTSFPPPAPVDWVFSPKNDQLFFTDDVKDAKARSRADRTAPTEWVERGANAIKHALSIE